LPKIPADDPSQPRKKSQDAMRDWSWRDWLHGEILCREAEALLEPDQKPKTGSAR